MIYRCHMIMLFLFYMLRHFCGALSNLVYRSSVFEFQPNREKREKEITNTKPRQVTVFFVYLIFSLGTDKFHAPSLINQFEKFQFLILNYIPETLLFFLSRFGSCQDMWFTTPYYILGSVRWQNPYLWKGKICCIITTISKLSIFSVLRRNFHPFLFFETFSVLCLPESYSHTNSNFVRRQTPKTRNILLRNSESVKGYTRNVVFQVIRDHHKK